MKMQELLNQISKLSAEIEELPKGYISTKTIGGRVYYYHQWSEKGQKKSRYLHDDEIEALNSKIERRKELQAKLKELRHAPKSKGKQKVNEASQMKCTLMHKRIEVAEIEIDDVTGFIQKIGAVYAPEHLPVGTKINNNIVDRQALNEWWTDRSIPASRSGIREALEALEIADTKMLLIRCFGLSLSDQYWIRPYGSDLEWDNINFFNNPFSDDIGDVLFGVTKNKNALDFSSPESTLDGNLKKRWKIIDGKRCLVKGGSNPFRQQPFNEVIAADIMDRLGIDHISYSVTWNNGAPYSVCQDFVTSDTELIPAWRIYNSRKKSNSDSVYTHFVKCAEALGICGVTNFLDRMIVVDYIIGNEDRHLNNFGALRNAKTLEWLGMAPIYDSGSSLGYDRVASKIRHGDDLICKPFKNHHEEQLKLVTDFSWIDFSKLSDVREIIKETLTMNGADEYIDESRIIAIADTVEGRIERLCGMALSNAPSQNDSQDDDVEEDIAEDYSHKPMQ